jgi:glycosyltransferase involved in cell wall biosynthesis
MATYSTPVLPPARRAANAVRSVLDCYRYPLPRLRTSASQHHAPTVYFCTPDYNVPSGGIRVVYRHADVLNEAGIPAVVLHRRPDFRCTWFENRTQVLCSREALIGPQDLVVVSELSVSLGLALPPGFRFVVFNQNPHLTWRRVSEEVVQRYARSPDLAAILTVSSHSTEMLQHLAPAATVIRLHNSVDPRLFFPGDPHHERSIAYMPRRGRDEARQVLGILHGRGALKGWEVMAIGGLCEREVGDRLRSAMIFLSFAYHEGFGLPAAEAMACGAYVIGFHGFGGREFFRPEFSSPIEPGDILGLARAVERVLARETLEPGSCAKLGAAAANFVATEYSPDRERRDVVDTYTALIVGCRVPPPQAP